MARDDEPIAPEARTLMPSGLMRLEERIVLDASGIVDDHAAADNAADHPNDSHPPSHHDGVTDAHADGDAHMDSVGSTDPISDVVRAAVERTVASLLGHDAAEGGPPRVLAVSSSVHQADALAAAADGVHTVVFDGELASLDTLLQQIRQALGGRLAESIAIGTHGVEAGGFHLAGGAVVDLQSLQNPDMQAFWHALGAMVAPGGRIDLLACDAAAGPEGEALIESLEQLTGVNFAASVDRTGNVELGGDWVLETDGVRAGAIYFDAGRLPRFSEVLDNQPTITDTDPGNTAAGGGSAVVVDAGITVDDGDGGGDTLQGAAVRIKSGFHAGEDQLAFNTGLATGFGISGSYDAATGELILSGAASAAEYQQVLRTVTYQNTSGTPDTTAREIIFVIGDDFDTPGGFSYNAQNGHYYQLVDNQITWAAAEAAAAGSNLGGLQGYLHTLTSAGENTFVTNLIPGGQVFWLAASDAGTEGDWTWVAGPETGTQFWDGNASGTPVGGLYNNWGAGQPDNDSGADHSWIQDDGAWYSELGSQNARYFVEYGGMGTDAQGQFVAAVTLNVTSSNNAPVLDNTGDMYLSAIDEDDVASSGTTVANVIASATGDRITDVDGGALEGIAIIGVDSTHGDWRFSTDGGTTWNDIGAVANNNALLLRDTDLIRFQPDADWNGTVATGITFRAWDQTDGSPGAYGDASTSGGTSAFSTATETASITVNSINDVPTVSTPLVDQPATEDVLFTYQFGAASFIDVDTGDTLTYTATLDDGSPLPGWITFDSATRTFSGTPLNDDVGTLQVKVTADDGHGGTVSDTFTLTVTNVNDAPVVNTPLVDQGATEDVLFTYQFGAASFTDVDTGDTLTYTATLDDGSPLPGWITFDSATRTFSGTPLNDDVGTLQVKVTADDGHGGTVSDTFTLTVANRVGGSPEKDDPAPPPPPRNSGSSSSTSSSSDSSNSMSGDGGTTIADNGGDVGTDSGDASVDGDASDATDGSDAADAGDVGETADSGDAGGEASSAGGEAGGESTGGDRGVAGGGRARGSQAAGVNHHEREDEMDFNVAQILEQVSSVVMSGDLTTDESQPEEFREAWDSILGACVSSSEELAVYLKSAFRAVTESAIIYKSAEQSIHAMNQELSVTPEADLLAGADSLLTGVRTASKDVKTASQQLEQEILSAADASKNNSFDRVLEDVVQAALQRLMAANDRLYVETKALKAAAAVLRDARVSADGALDEVRLTEAVSQARLEAMKDVSEMRKSWDRVAQDVFSAFVERLAAERGAASESGAEPASP